MGTYVCVSYGLKGFAIRRRGSKGFAGVPHWRVGWRIEPSAAHLAANLHGRRGGEVSG